MVFGLATTLSVACATTTDPDTDDGVGDADETASGGYSADGGAGCYPGGDCECSQYLRGVTQCSADSQQTSCDCSACTALVPTSEAAPPTPDCAGSPVGNWELVRADLQGVPFRIHEYAQGTSIRCAAEIAFVDDTPRGVLVLGADGAAAGYTSDTVVSVKFMESCSSSSCEQLDVVGTCTGSCGQCNCENPFSGVHFEDGTWSEEEGKLDVRITPDGASSPSHYCVEGDKLTVQRPDDLTWEYRRVYLTGGCVLSSYGMGNSTCQAIPVAEAHCIEVGTAPVCAGLGYTACGEVPGCEVDGTCSGAGNSCDEYSGPGCAYYGCTPDANQYYPCTGDRTCADMTDSTPCVGFGCDWSSCKGEPTPCADFSVEQCGDVAHCALAGQ